MVEAATTPIRLDARWGGVPTDEPQRRVDLAHDNLRKFGTVYNTLAAVCDVHGTMEAIPGDMRSRPTVG